MTKSEQHRLIRELGDVSARMSRREREEFEMFRKRDRDDEDLDALSRDRLELLHRTYVTRSSKTDVNALWNQLTAKKKPEIDDP